MVQRPLDESVEFAENPEPRAPCVLLLDVSGSMDGEPIEELNAGLQEFKAAIAKDPIASKRVEVAIITFSDDAELVHDFATIDNFYPPQLTASGYTAMGIGIIQALQAIRERKDTYRRNGVMYFRPWLFLITDGQPTDSEEIIIQAKTALNDEERRKGVIFFPIGVEGANMEFLAQLSSERRPMKLKGLNFREFFMWLSASMQRVSTSRPGEKLNLPDASGWGEISV